MADIDIKYALNLPPKEAIAYFKSKGYEFSWNWKDVWQEAQVKAFSVAKMMQIDLLKSVRTLLDDALANGTTFQEFKRTLTPQLKAKGWWGKADVEAPDGTTQTVQLGSPWRLETIFRTNVMTSYSVGRYQQQMDMVDERPYWQYVAIPDARVRPSHLALNGLVFRYDDPFWDYYYPPCGFSCRCRVRTYSQRDIDRRNIEVQSSKGKLSVKDGKAVYRADGGTVSPDEGWGYNPGKAYLADLATQSAKQLPKDLQSVVKKDLDEIKKRDAD